MYLFFVWLIGLVLVAILGMLMSGGFWWMNVMKLDCPLDCGVFFGFWYIIGTYLFGAMQLMKWLLS